MLFMLQGSLWGQTRICLGPSLILPHALRASPERALPRNGGLQKPRPRPPRTSLLGAGLVLEVRWGVEGATCSRVTGGRGRCWYLAARGGSHHPSPLACADTAGRGTTGVMSGTKGSGGVGGEIAALRTVRPRGC